MSRTISALTRCALLTLAFAAGTSAFAQDVTFAGKTISVYAAGGGYSLYARTLAMHIGKRLPGDPTVIVKELPGAGTLMSANYIYEAAKKDGTEIAAVGGSVATVQLYKTPGIRFDPRNFVWLGSISSEVGVAAATDRSGITSIQQVLDRKMLVGGSGPSSGNVVFPTLSNGVLGTKFEIVRGYKGSEEIALAMERGEVEGVMSWNWSSIKSARSDWVRDGKIKILLQLALSGHPELKGVPLIADLAKTDEQKAAVELVFASQGMARPYILPPGTPKPIIAIWRKAFADMLADPAFEADLKKLNLDFESPMNGPQVEAMIARLYATPEDVLNKVNGLMAVK
jgi:tripartite-type tricarboxylate transporter receptor subunit TctC